MKKINSLLLALLLVAALFQAMPGTVRADEMTKTRNGIEAALKVDPSKSMIDLYLADAKTREAVTEAKVRVKVALPDGTVVEKDLLGMKMGPAFSFMNTLDMSSNGRYSFDILVETGKTTASFRFTADI